MKRLSSNFKGSTFARFVFKFGFFAFLAFFGAATYVAAQGQSNNAPGALKAPKKEPTFPFCQLYFLVFSSASDEFSFHIVRDQGTAAGILRVRTMDCCIPGDEWEATITAERPSSKSGVGVSDGNTSTFNGDASVAPFIEGDVTISYSQGVDIFGAGMAVEICYSREGKDGDPISISGPN